MSASDEARRPPPLQERWEGRNTFVCGGRCIAGPTLAPVRLVMAIVTIPTALGLAATHQFYAERTGSWLTALIVVLYVVTIVQLWAVALTEPGIVPRLPPRPHVTQNGNMRKRPPKLQYTVEGSHGRTPLKHCAICEVIAPPRTVHCNTCNNCVMRYDHHCPWMGTCIGLRNYGHFWRFLTLLLVLNIAMIALPGVHIALVTVEERSFWDAITSHPGSVFGFIYSFVGIFFSLGMQGYHCNIAFLNETTYESIGAAWLMRTNPYPRDGRAIFKLLCSRPPPSGIRDTVHQVPRAGDDSGGEGELDAAQANAAAWAKIFQRRDSGDMTPASHSDEDLTSSDDSSGGGDDDASLASAVETDDGPRARDPRLAGSSGPVPAADDAGAASSGTGDGEAAVDGDGDVDAAAHAAVDGDVDVDAAAAAGAGDGDTPDAGTPPVSRG